MKKLLIFIFSTGLLFADSKAVVTPVGFLTPDEKKQVMAIPDEYQKFVVNLNKKQEKIMQKICKRAGVARNVCTLDTTTGIIYKH